MLANALANGGYNQPPAKAVKLDYYHAALLAKDVVGLGNHSSKLLAVEDSHMPRQNDPKFKTLCFKARDIANACSTAKAYGGASWVRCTRRV